MPLTILSTAVVMIMMMMLLKQTHGQGRMTRHVYDKVLTTSPFTHHSKHSLIRIFNYRTLAKRSGSTRRALGWAHVPPTKVFRRLTGSVNKTTVKPRVAAAVGRKTILKPRLAAAANTYTWHFPDSGESNPVPTSGFQSGSGLKVN